MQWIRGLEWWEELFHPLDLEIHGGWKNGPRFGAEYDQWLSAAVAGYRHAQAYVVTATIADTALSALNDFVGSWPDRLIGIEFVDEREEEWLEASEAHRLPPDTSYRLVDRGARLEYQRAIATFLRRFGPLERTYRWAMTLDFHLDAERLADFYQRVEMAETASDRATNARDILTECRDVLREDMDIEPLFRSGGLAFDATPTTLRAHLWLHLFSRCGRNVRLFCRYCNMPFEAGEGMGRTPRYCPIHRGAKFRQAVLALRAPSRRSAHELEPRDLYQPSNRGIR